ncbi:LuxR C-terminal-related transcriptional regulator [Actinomycetospora endophytica]|uniref:LuxR C-terminal-related transcriptional regulator n=1 Tax=Actinomycetospora endophytica TaxID=2291215 RepID=A0ABS8PAX1_9PSEU|nr:LuxR C-terminal-related transcriptional regulator [Actinomycetospora endophytica]MCD2195417.1 LuxR C-terminal-related transcriptional regulator [Actinomycetospora endophytica]
MPVDLVARPALAARVELPGPAVGLVVAPAGFGKTLLLADHAARDPGTAWVTVDRSDDPGRLWTAILAALTRCPALPPGSGLRELTAPYEPGGLAFLSRFRDGLGTRTAPLTLVLDDLHELDDPAALGEVRALLDHRPEGLRVILASRFDPPVVLSPLRDRQELWELRADRLAFTRTETEVLARQAGLALLTEQTGELHRRTGGWPAGLRLAVQAMRGGADPSTFLTEFSGEDRAVADYLVGEVLATLPDDLLEFLTLASIGDPLPAELAVLLTGRTDAAAVLDRVERETSLVSGLLVDRRTGAREYRLLELLRTYLAADLHRHRPTLAAELHGRAALWWADQDQPAAALENAARAADEGITARLADRFGLRLALAGEHAPLRRALPVTGVTAGLSATVGTALARVGGDVAALHEAIRALPAPGPDEGPAVRALRALGRGVDGLVSGFDPDTAIGELEGALELARDHGYDFVAMQAQVVLAAVAAVRGDFRTVVARADEAVSTMIEHRWEPSAWSTLGRTLRAYAALYRAEPGQARAEATEALEALDRAPERDDPRLRHALRIVRGAALGDLGDRATGLAEMRRARTELEGLPVVADQAAAAALFENRAALRLGDSVGAAQAARELADRLDAPGEAALMAAWAELGSGHLDAASHRIRPVLRGTATAVMPHTLVEAHLVAVTLAVRAGDPEAGRRALGAALAAAEDLDLLRPFALGGPEVGALLAELPPRPEPAATFAARALDAYRRIQDPAANPLLSERELAVLALLPSLMSSDDIAAALSVSVSTVKTHVRMIYAKLAVANRRAAVETARTRGLLPSHAGADL